MTRTHEAIVTRRPLGRQDCYLQLDTNGVQRWTSDPLAATAFPSMREAARMALRLPADLKAYGLPRGVEVEVAGSIH